MQHNKAVSSSRNLKLQNVDIKLNTLRQRASKQIEVLLKLAQISKFKSKLQFDSSKHQTNSLETTTMQTSRMKKKQNRACYWLSKEEDQIQISKINKAGIKQVIYYTPKEGISTHSKIFHPCDWSINDFQVGRHLGKGKYGHVYLVRQRKSKQILALKVLSKKQLTQNDIVFQLRRELEIHSHLKHKNILKMYGFFFDEKKIYIILDYAPKGQLYKILQEEKKFAEQKAANYIFQMIKAVQHLHSLKIMHRDIKPQNILVSIHDEIKLTDFGWSIHVSDNQKKRRTFCGTPDYLCPEIAFQKQYDYRIDLWCIGVLAYQLVAGHPPFHDVDDKKQLIRRIKQVSFEFPQFFSPDLRNFISLFLKSKAEERMTLQEAQKHPWIINYHLHPKNQQHHKNEPRDIEI